MLDIIKAQFKSGKSLTQNKYYSYVNRDSWPKFFWDLYPIGQEYYHELNPYFLFQSYRPDIYKFSRVITVRDGYLTFASYLVNHFKEILTDQMRPILIPPEFAPIVPANIMDRFACWQIVQKKQISLSDAKKVIVFGLVSEEYLGNLEDLPRRLEPLRQINPEASVDLLLPMRKDIFGKNNKESMVIYHALNHIKDAIPGKKVNFIKIENFLELANLKNTYIFDLNFDKMVVADNYLHYFSQSRGATVNNGSLLHAPEDSMFHLDLSIFHELHITPFPQVKSIFAELIFHKKTNPHMDLNFDTTFQHLLRNMFQKNLSFSE
jgi:hypothetical protein